jgi:hypothetical protein
MEEKVMSLSVRVAVLFLSVYGLWACSSASKNQSENKSEVVAITPAQAEKIAEDAYVFGFPLVLMDVSKQVSTNVTALEKGRAPINHFAHFKEFPDYRFRDVVTPNADTLYSFSWLDLGAEPIVLSLPDTGKRYYMMPMLDAWTNVFDSPGTRTTGNKKGNFAIVGPGWTGKLPNDVKKIQSPTNLVWMMGRTKTNGPSDYKAVSSLQDQYLLVPLSQWKGTSYITQARPVFDGTIDMKTAPVEQVVKMDAMEFYRRLGELMRDNPPAAADAKIIERFRKVGYRPGEFFDASALPDNIQESLESGAQKGLARIQAQAADIQGKKMNGWIIPTGLGNYGTEYEKRATVALIGLGANLDADAIYPRAIVDADGQKLSGLRNYVIHFPKGQTPPVKGFWSISMYNSDQFFVKNPLNRYAIGDRDKLTYNKDGSLDIYIQSSTPGRARESNWLPSPREEFNLVMRLYWPQPSALDGTWQIPGVQKSMKANNLAGQFAEEAL